MSLLCKHFLITKIEMYLPVQVSHQTCIGEATWHAHDYWELLNVTLFELISPFFNVYHCNGIIHTQYGWPSQMNSTFMVWNYKINSLVLSDFLPLKIKFNLLVRYMGLTWPMQMIGSMIDTQRSGRAKIVFNSLIHSWLPTSAKKICLL